MKRKLTRSQLRRLILESTGPLGPYGIGPSRPDSDFSDIDIDDDSEDSDDKEGNFILLTSIVDGMIDEIEGSHGGLDTGEAAGELVRRLQASITGDLSEILAEMLLDSELELRSITRRTQR